MDAIDKNILNQLQKNAKKNTKEIAAEAGLSITPTYERIKKLEQKEIIKDYVAILDRKKIGIHLVGFCQISITPHTKRIAEKFINSVLKLDQVMECYQVSGTYDYLIKIVVPDIEAMHYFINEELSEIDGISSIHNAFVLNTIKHTTAYQL